MHLANSWGATPLCGHWTTSYFLIWELETWGYGGLAQADILLPHTARKFCRISAIHGTQLHQFHCGDIVPTLHCSAGCAGGISEAALPPQDCGILSKLTILWHRALPSRVWNLAFSGWLLHCTHLVVSEGQMKNNSYLEHRPVWLHQGHFLISR